MELSQILAQTSEIVASGIGVYLATEAVKASKSISFIQPGQVARIRAAAAVLSAIAVVITKLADGSLDAVTIQDTVQAVIALIGTMALAHGVHESIKKTKE